MLRVSQVYHHIGPLKRSCVAVSVSGLVVLDEISGLILGSIPSKGSDGQLDLVLESCGKGGKNMNSKVATMATIATVLGMVLQLRVVVG